MVPWKKDTKSEADKQDEDVARVAAAILIQRLWRGRQNLAKQQHMNSKLRWDDAVTNAILEVCTLYLNVAFLWAWSPPHPCSLLSNSVKSKYLLTACPTSSLSFELFSRIIDKQHLMTTMATLQLENDGRGLRSLLGG